jgi:hypothetical protein
MDTSKQYTKLPPRDTNNTTKIELLFAQLIEALLPLGIVGGLIQPR